MRRLITDHVDFDLIRSKSPVDLLIAATHVATGRARLFRRDEITIDAGARVGVSAGDASCRRDRRCGLLGWRLFRQPPISLPLASESPVGDTLLVMVSPRVNAKLPTTARDISNHANRLTFNAPLLRDIEVVTAVRETSGALLAKDVWRRSAGTAFHLIDGGPVTGALNPRRR